MVKDNNTLIVDLLPKTPKFEVTTHKHPRHAPAPTNCRPPETKPTAPENRKQGHHHAPAIYPTAPPPPPPPSSLSLSLSQATLPEISSPKPTGKTKTLRRQRSDDSRIRRR
ncbi:hypothetical protein RHGRI_007902 [Rhododendron griersonianum]|uniref:Uncharacterized protein n=1 Tax=Rhododendron griersonianum TaxID=479676 RepID=A0AAV6KYF7_9ERIC|nr:hypothetical protein RHGRI_007902 [Rhododendron griersonianum]